MFFNIFLNFLIISTNAFTLSLTNRYSMQYDLSIYIGTPTQSLSCIFDTTSTWIEIPSVQCTNCLQSLLFNCSESTSCIQKQMNYVVDDMAIGNIFMEKLVFNENITVINQTMLLLMKEMKDETESVIGLGLEGILSNSSYSLIATLKNQKIINKAIFAFYLSNSAYSTSIESEIMIGEYNNNLISTPLQYFPVGSNDSWSFNASNFAMDDKIIDNTTKTVIISSSFDYINIPFQSYLLLLDYLKQNFEACLTIGNLIKCSCPTGSSDFPVLRFYIDSIEFSMEPTYYITEEESVCSLKISSGDSTNNNWILGIGFLQKYYTVFDAENRKIGLAESVKASLRIDLVYLDTILVGVILFIGFFIGLALIYMIEKLSGIENKTEDLELR